MSSPLRTFLDALYQWSDAEASSYKVWCNTYRPPGSDREVLPAYGYTDASDMESAIRRAVQYGNTVYVATGSFVQAKGQRKNGAADVSRTGANISRMKALFLDIDAGAGKPYPDNASVRSALDAFVQEAGVWRPTFVVNSGSAGGLHAYWVMDKAIEHPRWVAMAEALKKACKLYHLHADDNVTADAARVLRPPESYNYKSNPRHLVTLETTGSYYTPEQLEKSLERFALRVAGGTQSFTRSANVPPPPRPMRGNTAENFGAGVEDTPTTGPVDVDALVDAGCGVVKNALETGGATHSEPLWKQLMLLATFCVDGEEVAHEFSNGHPGYSEAATDQKYAERVRYKQENNLGWPKCSTFEGLGCKECLTCKHRSADKTPFHAVPKPTRDPSQPSGTTPLPPGYLRGNGDIIFKQVTNREGGPSSMPVTPRPVFNAALTPGAEHFIVEFHVSGDGSKRVTIAAESSDLATGQSFTEFYAKHHIVYPHPMQKEGWIFMTAWRNHLIDLTSKSGQYVHLNKIGWTGDEFVYAEKKYSKAGAAKALLHGMKLSEQYTPIGNLEPWCIAVKYFTDNGWIAHQCIVATSFASPLMELTGVNGSAVIVFFSPESGQGKTTGVRIGQSVWGNPRTGLLKSDDTANAIAETITALRHLPIYWDEAALNNQHVNGSTGVRLLMRASEGVSKRRLNREANFRAQDSFAQMSVITTNESLHEHVVANENMGAVMRLLEFEVPKYALAGTSVELDTLIAKLNTNYGWAGEKYAEYIGANVERLRKDVLDWRGKLESASGGSGDERFWWSAVATIMVGAAAANALGLAKFDLQGMLTYLYKGVLAMRGEAKAAKAAVGMSFNVDDFFATLQSQGRQAFMLFTKHGLYVSPGRPSKNVDAAWAGANDRVMNVWAQYDVENEIIRCATRQFAFWCKKNYPNLPVKVILDELRQRGIWDGAAIKRSIGAGIGGFGADMRCQCYDFILSSPGSNPGSSSH